MTHRAQRIGRGGRLLLYSSLLLAAPLAYAAPAALDDAVLRQLTAGATELEASGGAIVGNGSTAVIDRSSAVVLSDTVQSGARGLNMVNSSASAVANAVNVWDGEGAASTDFELVQLNDIQQARQRSAVMSDYTRSEADTTVSVERTHSESIDTQSHHAASMTNLESSKHVFNDNSSAEVDTRLVLSIGDPASDTGQFNLEANIGQGVAVSGHLAASYDGGSAELAVAAKGKVSAKPEINVGPYFKAGVEVSAEAELSLYHYVELPKMDIEITGAGCGVVLGSCTAAGVSSESSEEISDHSTLDTVLETAVGASHTTEVSVEEIRSPFTLGQAQAEYIVVDHSSLIVDNAMTLELSGAAQSNVRAMNVVNAVGSAVTNAVNISRTHELNSDGGFVLTQSNVVTHGR